MTANPNIHRWTYQDSRGLPRNTNQALNTWQDATCTLLQESWNSLLGQGVQLKRTGTDLLPAHSAVRELPDPGYGAQLSVGPSAIPSLIAGSARLVMALVSDLLGVAPKESPAPEGVSPAELSMIELLFGEVCRAAAQGWPALQTLECQLHSIVDRPLRTRLFAPDDVVVRTRIGVETALGGDAIVWITPAESLQELLGELPSAEQEPAVQAAPGLRSVAEQIRLMMVVELGRAHVSLADLQHLAPGDVVVLDQPAAAPLRGVVGGETRCLGSPCRIGGRQGFHVHSIVDS